MRWSSSPAAAGNPRNGWFCYQKGSPHPTLADRAAVAEFKIAHSKIRAGTGDGYDDYKDLAKVDADIPAITLNRIVLHDEDDKARRRGTLIDETTMRAACLPAAHGLLSVLSAYDELAKEFEG